MKNKKILFIAPKFYNYHQEIIDVMTFRGASVTFFSEDIISILYRISKKIIPPLAKCLKQNHIRRILNDCSENKYDIVFIIRRGILSSSIM